MERSWKHEPWPGHSTAICMPSYCFCFLPVNLLDAFFAKQVQIERLPRWHFPPPLTPNLSVLTLCWVMGSVSLNLPSLMSGFKKGFPIFLVISWTSFLFYSRQKAFRFSRKYFKSIKSIFNRSGLQVLWMKGLSSFGSNIWDKERNKRQCTRDKERNQSVNISWV